MSANRTLPPAHNWDCWAVQVFQRVQEENEQVADFVANLWPDSLLSFFSKPTSVNRTSKLFSRQDKYQGIFGLEIIRSSHQEFSPCFLHMECALVMKSCIQMNHQIFLSNNLRSQFKVAPNLVIYDIACKLHQYCLNREPAFFKHTQFVVNGFSLEGSYRLLPKILSWQTPPPTIKSNQFPDQWTS